MNKEEIQELIDQSIAREIKKHEIRVGWISGTIGIIFVFGIIHAIWLMKNWIS